MPSSTIHNYSASPSCPICGQALIVRLARGRKSGKPFVMLRCGEDGRHFRGFIHNRDYVAGVMERLEHHQQEQLEGGK